MPKDKSIYPECSDNNTNDFLLHSSLCHCDQQGYDIIFPSGLLETRHDDAQHKPSLVYLLSDILLK